jgi:hypothetical protein
MCALDDTVRVMTHAFGLALAVAVSVAIAGSARPADAYEFEVVARTIGQGFELRSFRLFGGDVILSRRRFTQGLGLEIRDIGNLARPDRRGVTVGFSSYLRVDHDFGDWTMGELDRDGRAIDAIDAIPELTSSSLAIDLLYAYVRVDGLAGGRVALRAGRLIELDRFDAWAWDGALARVHTPWHVGVEVAGGLRVRDASPIAPASYELDGTQGADCTEYVEGATPGSGSWQIIDRSRVPGTSPFVADLDYCPQREVVMPAFAVAVETERIRAWHARLGYRRSMSPTVGVIGEVDRLDFPDVGLYPNENGQAPGWGVNEEQLSLSADGRWGRVAPWAGARWSLLHAAVADAAVGARVAIGEHSIEPELAYARPIFDGDSVWSAFVTYPSLDARVGWRWKRGPWRAHAQTWLRRYDLGDGSASAGGADARADWRRRDLTLGVAGLADGGWGGRRAGGTLRAEWRRTRYSTYGARAGLLRVVDEAGRVDPTTAPDPGRIHGSVSLAGTWHVLEGVAFRAVAEGTSSRQTPAELRLLAVLDLAFKPEI